LANAIVEEARFDLSGLGEPEWVLAARRSALSVFEDTPWPTRYDEGWRRTDVTNIPFDELVACWKPSPAEDAGLSAEAAKQGVILTDLGTAIREHPDKLRDKLTIFPDDPVERKFLSLARALWTDGVFLFVPKGVEVSVPLHVKATFGDSRFVSPRLVLVAEPGSKVTLLDEHLSGDFSSPALANGIADLFVGDGAHVTYVHLNRWGSGVNNFHHIRAEIGRDAHLVSLQLALGSELTKATNEARLIAPGARSDMLGLAFGMNAQRFEHHTLQHHVSGKTESDILFKVAVADEAKSVYTGMIRIDREAQQASAYQTNQNILLSKDARADTVPNLEILANDVKCSHGATVAPLDENQVFYLMARGITETEAKRLIVAGFLDQVLDRAELGALDEYVRASAEEVLTRELAKA